MHDPDPAAADQPSQLRGVAAQGARQPGHAPRIGQSPADDGQRALQHLDPGGAQGVGEDARAGEHDQRLEAAAIDPGGQQFKLAVGPVVAAGRVQVEDADGAQSATVSASAGASGNSSGCRMWASSSSPSTMRGPGREK